MGITACVGLRCRPWKSGADARGVMVVAVLWRIIVKSSDDGVEAGGQICHNCNFDANQFCDGDDAGAWGVGLGRYMARDRVFFA